MPFLEPPRPPSPTVTDLPVASPVTSVPGGGGSFDLSDLKHYFHILVRRFWLVALCFIISLGISVYSLLQQVDTYDASARLLLTRGFPGASGLQLDDTAGSRVGGGDFFPTQIQIMNSRELRRSARQLSSYPPAVLDANIRGTRVSQVWSTSMLQITVTSLDPAVGADYANALARAYEEFRAEERLNVSQGTLLGLMQQANRLKEELERAEDRLLGFRREHRVLGMAERNNLAEEAMFQLARRAIGYRLERLLLENQQPLLANAGSEVVLRTLVGYQPEQPPTESGEDDPVEVGRPARPMEAMGGQQAWESVRKEQAFLQAELVALRQDFRDAHPSIVKVLRRLKELDRLLGIELEFARQQFLAHLESLRIREEAAARVEREWEDEAMEVSRQAFAYAGLEREVDRLRNMNNVIYDRLRQVDIATAFEPGSVRIIEEAVPAGSPRNPRKLQNLFLAALMGIGIGIGLVIGIEFIDDSIRYPEDISRRLGVPFMGVVPSVDWDPDDLSSHLFSNLERNSALAEAYRNIRSSLLFAASRREMHVLAIISAVPKEGKTTTAINLAVSLAQAGGRILLVDADLRRGELHKYFGLDGGRGLADILAGQSKPESVIQRSGIAGLDVVATGPFPPNPAEMILSREFYSFIEYAKRNYDRIIFDCPPVMAVSEASVLACLADAVLYVVWGGHTSRKMARNAVQILQEKGAHLAGAILNNLEFGRVGYYYYYSGYYYDSYYREEDTVKSEV